MIEIWKDIPNYDGRYQISNLGRVRSFMDRHGTVKDTFTIKSSSLTKDGYVKVRLIYTRKGLNETKRIHRLVAEVFIPNEQNKETVNHIDGNKLNNMVCNLEWANRKEQLIHAYRTGLRISHRGSSNSQSKLTDEQIIQIRNEYKKNDRRFSSVKLAEKYGVSHRVILLIVNNKSYKNVEQKAQRLSKA